MRGVETVATLASERPERPGWRQPRALRAWLAVAVCVGLIWSLSSDSFSANATSGYLGPFLRWLLPKASYATRYEIHVFIRKSAHAIEYALLALLTYRAAYLSRPGTLLRHAGLALALVFAVAGLDELRQSFSSARTGSLRDVALDVSGGLAALAVLWTIHRLRSGPAAEPSGEA